MFIKQLSVFVENKAGRMAEIAGLIAQAGIDIRALSIADTTNFGILRLIVDQPYQAEKLLKEARLTASLTDVIAVSVPDRPGGFAETMRAFAESNISVEYMYAFISPQDADRACIIMRVEDNDTAIRLLRENHVPLLSEADVYSM